MTLHDFYVAIGGDYAAAVSAMGDEQQVVSRLRAFPYAQDYAGLLDALTYMLGDELLMTKLGAFRNANGVYTIPVIITADVSDSGLMEGGTIAETVIVNLHLFD